VPSFFFGLGTGPGGPNHSPQFKVDDAALPVGAGALLHLLVSHQFDAASGAGAPPRQQAGATAPVAAAETPAGGAGSVARNLH
jgi:hypothetical protein